MISSKDQGLGFNVLGVVELLIFQMQNILLIWD